MSSRDGSSFFDDLARHAEARDKLAAELSFEEYLETLRKERPAQRNAHQLLYEALTHRPNYFESGPYALFGLQETVNRLLTVLKAGGEGLDPRHRIILFVGPPGSGKSTMVTAMKRALEEYTRTPEGAVYALKDCPLNEDPLNLLPEEMRARFEAELGYKIEGYPCPVCNSRYRDMETLRSVKVRRVFFSERDRVGVATFAPHDPKSQDITELIGSVNLAKLAQAGTASDPEAFSFDGELERGNRGLMEFVEMLKADPQFLQVLIWLTTENNIKAPRFPNIYADEVVIAHTNETEYKKFMGNPANEALRDRIIAIPVPYNTKVSEEVKVYDKLIRASKAFTSRPDLHVSPATFRAAATFAVLTRLQDSSKADRLAKLKLYDGEEVGELTERDVRELKEEATREGMEGISPRMVIDSLSTALVEGDRKCLTAVDALRALKGGIDVHPHTKEMPTEQKEAIRNLLADARREYDTQAKREVQSSFIYSHREAAQSICDNYLRNVEAYLQKTKLKDPITDEDVEPDEAFMRSIEEKIVPETGKDEFRNGVLHRVASLAMRGEARFTYESHRMLKEGIEAKLYNDMGDTIVITTSATHPDPEQLKRRNEVAKRLIEEKGYCAECANDIIRYVGTLLQR